VVYTATQARGSTPGTQSELEHSAQKYYVDYVIWKNHFLAVFTATGLNFDDLK
jgi:hypothetical protein